MKRELRKAEEAVGCRVLVTGCTVNYTVTWEGSPEEEKLNQVPLHPHSQEHNANGSTDSWRSHSPQRKEVSAVCNTHFTICITSPLVWKCFRSGPAYLADRKLFKSSTMFSLITEYIYFGLRMKERHSGADSPLMGSHSCSTLARERMLMQFVKQNYGIFFLTGKEKHSTMRTVFVSECSGVRVD